MSISYDAGENKYKNWIVEESEFNLENLAKFESLFSLGNGYMGLRAATEEKYTGETRGFYIAGIFDEFPGEVTEMPNLPDWINTEVYINEEKFQSNKGKIYEYNRQLNLKEGLLTRSFIWESPQGAMIEFFFERFISMDNLHLGLAKIDIKPLNFSGEIKIISGFNGRVTNSGSQHLKEGEKRLIDDYVVYKPSTQESNVDMSFGLHHEFFKNDKSFEPQKDFKAGRRIIKRKFRFDVKQKDKISIIKRLSAFTKRDNGIDKNQDLTKKMLENLEVMADKNYETLKNIHINKWQSLWDDIDVKISGSDFDQLAIRFALFHLIQMTPAHDERISIGAKGLTGERYKGHVFWDTEIFILPFFIYNKPEIAKSLLKYRYNTLDGAREKAKENGYKGAMFAWESAETGRETTPKYGSVDILTGEEIRIWCGEIEQHITADIQYAFNQYYEATDDRDFMEEYGFEVFFAGTRFWASRLEYNEDKEQYEINNIMGPDEYKEHVDNNAFINHMVNWQFVKAFEYIEELKKRDELFNKIKNAINLTEDEIKDWQVKKEKLYQPQPDENNIIPQFDGFEELPEIDLTKYKKGEVGDIFNDLSWEKINKSKVAKQADVVMLTYLLSERFKRDIIKDNYEYYEPITLHDSSLSPAIHAAVASSLNKHEEAYMLFKKAAKIDLGENMESSNEGLHAASLGGLWQSILFGFAGISLKDSTIFIEPKLPDRWNMISFKLKYKGNKYNIVIGKEKIKVDPLETANVLEFKINGKYYKIKAPKKIRY